MSQKIYKGTWQSTKHHPSVSSGCSYTYLPDPLNAQTLANFQSNVYIDYEGVFRHGQQISLPMIVSQIENTVPLQFKLVPVGSQVVVFHATVQENGNIVGTYNATVPQDVGTFSMIMPEDQSIPIRTPKDCIIL